MSNIGKIILETIFMTSLEDVTELQKRIVKLSIDNGNNKQQTNNNLEVHYKMPFLMPIKSKDEKQLDYPKKFL